MRFGWVGIFGFALPLLVPVNLALAGVTASFRYPLSNFSGPVRSQWARLAVDRERNEVYSLRERKNDIRVFDEHGMEIFVFGDGFASAADITIGDDGDIFILSRGNRTATVHLLDYRGEHVSEIPLQNVPAAFSKFVADRLVHSQRSLYLVDSDALIVVVTDEAGRFKEGHDLNEHLKPFVPRLDREQKQLANYDWKKRKLEDIDLNGFTVDGQGNIFFTVPVLFSAYKLSVDGELTEFGRSGSGRGKFGVAAGIATDEMGYVYVADRLRCVVMVFDRDLQFQTEFGYRGNQPSNLVVPDDLAIDSSGNIYVGQAANRGVSVFRIAYEKASPSPKASPTRKYEEEGRSPVRKKASRSKRSKAGENASRSQDGKEASPSRAGEDASPSKGSDTTSTGSEKYGRAIEEDASKRLEFIVDHGEDAPSADSEKDGWTVEGNESNQLEIIGNEEDQ
jgi:sugar lactone lactonase YvrE